MNDSNERELELLLQQLKENADIDLRCHAAKQLGTKKSKASIVVPALIEALSDDNWLVRVEAATALGNLGGHAKSAIEALNYTMSEPRNRPKRGIFYEVIQTIKDAPDEEPIITPSVVAEEPPVEVFMEEKVEVEVASFEETTIEPIVEPSEEVVEDVVEEPIFEDEEVTEEMIAEPTEIDEVDIDEEIVEAAEEIIDEAFGDFEETEDVTTPSEVVEEIAEIEPVVEAESEIEEETTVGEDITEIVEDVAEDISEYTSEDEIIEEAIEEIAEEVLEDVLEQTAGEDVDHEIIDDIAEEITEEILEMDEELEEEDDEEDTEWDNEYIEEPVETFQPPEVIESKEIIQPPEVIAPPTVEDEEETTDDIPLDDVLEFEDDKKKIDEQPRTIAPPTVEDVKTVRMSKALLKIVLVGDAAVGKTTLRKQYSEDSFSQEYRDIIGADFSTKHFTKNGENFSLQIWDIAAKERFDSSKDLFFRGIYGVLLIFDVTNRESFKSIRKWLADIQNVENKELAIVLVGNKVDLRSDQETAVITRDEGQALAKELSEEMGFSISYVETSAETGAGVEVAFRMLEERSAELFFSLRDK